MPNTYTLETFYKSTLHHYILNLGICLTESYKENLTNTIIENFHNLLEYNYNSTTKELSKIIEILKKDLEELKNKEEKPILERIDRFLSNMKNIKKNINTLSPLIKNLDKRDISNKKILEKTLFLPEENMKEIGNILNQLQTKKIKYSIGAIYIGNENEVNELISPNENYSIKYTNNWTLYQNTIIPYFYHEVEKVFIFPAAQFELITLDSVPRKKYYKPTYEENKNKLEEIIKEMEFNENNYQYLIPTKRHIEPQISQNL